MHCEETSISPVLSGEVLPAFDEWKFKRYILLLSSSWWTMFYCMQLYLGWMAYSSTITSAAFSPEVKCQRTYSTPKELSIELNLLNLIVFLYRSIYPYRSGLLHLHQTTSYYLNTNVAILMNTLDAPCSFREVMCRPLTILETIIWGARVDFLSVIVIEHSLSKSETTLQL